MKFNYSNLHGYILRN